MACNSGISLIPEINGKVRRFRSYGLYNGMSIFTTDRYPDSYWEHMTGECIHGEMQGHQLQYAGTLLHMTAQQALQTFPSTEIAISKPHPVSRIVGNVLTKLQFGERNYLPSWLFTRTLEGERYAP